MPGGWTPPSKRGAMDKQEVQAMNGKFQAHLADAKKELSTVLIAAVDRLEAATDAAVAAAVSEKVGVAASPQQCESTKDVFTALARESAGCLDQLSSMNQETARQQRVALSAAFDIKLSHARSAANMSMLNTKAEMETAFHRRTEERLSAARGEGNADLSSAHRELEATRSELNKTRIHLKQKVRRSRASLSIAASAKLAASRS